MLHDASNERVPSLRLPPCVSDDGVVWRVDHGRVVHGGEVSLHQLEVVQPQHSRPDGFNLNVGEVFSDTAVATCRRSTRNTTSVTLCNFVQNKSI